MDLTTHPKRIQLHRSKGWRKPENTISVARPTKWGNPFTIGGTNGMARRPGAISGLEWEFENRISAPGLRHTYHHNKGRITHCVTENLTAEMAVILFTEALNNEPAHLDYVPRQFIAMRDSLHELKGKNLACWCPLDQPCHADVLLELAAKL